MGRILPKERKLIVKRQRASRFGGDGGYLRGSEPQAQARGNCRRWPLIIGGLIGALFITAVILLMQAAGFEISGLRFSVPSAY